MTRILLPLFLLLFPIAPAIAAGEPESISLPRHVLTNDGLTVLAKAGLGDGLLIDLVRHKRTHFDTSAEALAALARYGLSEMVIRAVVEKQEQVQLRKPRLVVSPAAPNAGMPAAMEVESGDFLVLPGPAVKKKNSEPDRWYKVSVQ